VEGSVGVHALKTKFEVVTMAPHVAYALSNYLNNAAFRSLST